MAGPSGPAPDGGPATTSEGNHMPRPTPKPKVRHYIWRYKNGDTAPAIRIDCGTGFAIIPYNQARQVVDQVHDLCDDHDRAQREKGHA